MFHFPVPKRYHRCRSVARTAEEDLKALFYNFEGTVPCNHLGFERAAYISGEYLTLPDDCAKFQSMVKMLCTFAGKSELRPRTVRVTKGQSNKFALKPWSYSSLPLAIADVEKLNKEYATQQTRFSICQQMKAIADHDAEGAGDDSK